MKQYAYIYLMQNHSTCFGCPSHPSSGVHKTLTAASGTGRSIWTTTFLHRGQMAKLEEGCCSIDYQCDIFVRVCVSNVRHLMLWTTDMFQFCGYIFFISCKWMTSQMRRTRWEKKRLENKFLFFVVYFIYVALSLRLHVLHLYASLISHSWLAVIWVKV